MNSWRDGYWRQLELVSKVQRTPALTLNPLLAKMDDQDDQENQDNENSLIILILIQDDQID